MENSVGLLKQSSQNLKGITPIGILSNKVFDLAIKVDTKSIAFIKEDLPEAFAP